MAAARACSRQANAISCPTKQRQHQKDLLLHREQFYKLRNTKKLKRPSLSCFIMQAAPVIGKIVILPSLQQHPSPCVLLHGSQRIPTYDSYPAPEIKRLATFLLQIHLKPMLFPRHSDPGLLSLSLTSCDDPGRRVYLQLSREHTPEPTSTGTGDGVTMLKKDSQSPCRH